MSNTSTISDVESSASTDSSTSALPNDEWNIVLEEIANIRDVAEACPGLRRGLLLRCAMPSQASENDIRFLLKDYGVRDMVDLRSSEELRDDSPDSSLFSKTSFIRWERHWATGQVQSTAVYQRSGAAALRHNVSLLERYRYFRGLLWKAPIISVVAATALRFVNKEASRQVMLREVNAGGLVMLYTIILESAKPELCAVMNVVLLSLEEKRPLMFFCKAGKDRTGIIAMLVLSCCGCPDSLIVSDYHRSDSIQKVALAGIEKKPELKGLDHSKFQGAPSEAMESTLTYIRSKYGSVRTYLACIGFGPEKQSRLVSMLVEPKICATSEPGTPTSSLPTTPMEVA